MESNPLHLYRAAVQARLEMRRNTPRGEARFLNISIPQRIFVTKLFEHLKPNYKPNAQGEPTSDYLKPTYSNTLADNNNQPYERKKSL